MKPATATSGRAADSEGRGRDADGGLSRLTKWVGSAATATVAVAGLAANVMISVRAGRTQQALFLAGQEFESATLVPAVQRIGQILAQGAVIQPSDFDSGSPSTPAEIRSLVGAFQEMDASFSPRLRSDLTSRKQRWH